jgi:uncharacterized integral membrane protein (TIGR00697 family)
MTNQKKELAKNLYLLLAGLFITSLVVSNLIFQKFFYWYPFDIKIFGNSLFELSVGVLPYPITFLITDLISEIYGKKSANQVVITGIFASFFSMGILLIANEVFALSPIAVLASMIAYLIAQFIDIRIYHFWKNLTKGKMLWLRNNFSTFTSQFVDSLLVIGLLSIFGVLEWTLFWGLVISSFLFKVLVAALDTPLLYLFVGIFRRTFHLKPTDEIEI